MDLDEIETTARMALSSYKNMPFDSREQTLARAVLAMLPVVRAAVAMERARGSAATDSCPSCCKQYTHPDQRSAP